MSHLPGQLQPNHFVQVAVQNLIRLLLMSDYGEVSTSHIPPWIDMDE